jgi:Tol biopolymer transport system component
MLVYQNLYLRSFQLVSVDREGTRLSTIGEPAVYQTIALSRDDRRLAVARRESSSNSFNIWTVNLATNAASRLTFGSARESDPAWSPDGSRVAYNAQRDGGDTLYAIPSTGGTETALMPPPRTRPALDDWSRDGRFLLYHVTPARELWALPLSGSGTPIPVRQVTRGTIDEATFSPDGRWIAYNADESGRSEVYVASFSGKGERWQISTAGGAQPRWRADGRELFYLALDGTMMAVNIKASESAVVAGSPQALFKTALPVSSQVDQYAVTGDGRRFVLINPVPGLPAAQFTAVLNWTAALDN